MKILVADDELVSRKKMQKIMETYGDCHVAETGRSAIAVFEEALEQGNPFDIVSLDIVRPDMDGIRALLKIREVEEKQDVPKEKEAKIMMVTSHAKKEIVIACSKAGANTYVVKPFDKETISKKLNEMGVEF